MLRHLSAPPAHAAPNLADAAVHEALPAAPRGCEFAEDAVPRSPARRRDSDALARGEPRVIQETLGHANYSTTMDFYSHVAQELQEDAAAKLNAALAP